MPSWDEVNFFFDICGPPAAPDPSERLSSNESEAIVPAKSSVTAGALVQGEATAPLSTGAVGTPWRAQRPRRQVSREGPAPPPATECGGLASSGADRVGRTEKG